MQRHDMDLRAARTDVTGSELPGYRMAAQGEVEKARPTSRLPAFLRGWGLSGLARRLRGVSPS